MIPWTMHTWAVKVQYSFEIPQSLLFPLGIFFFFFNCTPPPQYKIYSDHFPKTFPSQWQICTFFSSGFDLFVFSLVLSTAVPLAFTARLLGRARTVSLNCPVKTCTCDVSASISLSAGIIDEYCHLVLILDIQN